ncbi:MAG: rhomboid family intramembrane serine protease [Bacilli bacterium]|nr:rhomboid family intramembrane serine protease [Bacilli bacterium]
MSEVEKNNIDELVLKLLHYFVIERGYNPIVLHGAQNEIWLEKLNSEYKIVRIVTNYIHNNEQLSFDQFRTKQILKKIKKKTFSININTLSLFLNLGDNVQMQDFGNKLRCAQINNITDLNNYSFITEVFPDITTNTNFKEEGMELFMKITNDINTKNEKENKIVEKTFKMKQPIVTYTLITINVIVFLLMYIWGNGSTDIQTLLDFGANYRGSIVNGEYYRFVTCAFIHIGLLHLLFNCYALYIIGIQLESYYGKIKYIVIYLLSAVSASIMSVIFNDSISAGASGAIFGLLGALLYFGYHYRVYLGNALKSQIIPLIAINLMFGFLMAGIDNFAHIGGLIGGLLISMALGVEKRSTKEDIINGIIMSVIYFGFLLYMAFKVV